MITILGVLLVIIACLSRDCSLDVVRITQSSKRVMAQDSAQPEIITAKLHVSSENKQDLLQLLGSSKILIVTSINRDGNCLHFVGS